MDLDNFLNDVYGKPLQEEALGPDELNKEAEKFIKGLKKVRFNMMFKNIERISAFMKNQGATVRGVVKTTILNGAMELFKQSRERSQEFKKKKEDSINECVEAFLKKVKLDQTLAGVIEDAEFERISFEKTMERLSSEITLGISNNDQLTFFVTQFLKTEMLESMEEKKYHERAIEIIEYFVIQTMILRIIFSCIQAVIARIVSKIRLSKVEDAESKSKEVGLVLVRFFKEFVKTKYGLAIGEYLSTYVEDFYHSSNDKKEQFTKFENIINIMLGVSK